MVTITRSKGSTPHSAPKFTRSRLLRRLGIFASCTALMAATVLTITVGAQADSNVPAPPLPVFTPTPTNWGPNLGRSHAREITEVDITSEREMCEWFNAQFDILMAQINTFNANLNANHDDYSAPGIQQQADAVTANIDQSEDYLAPRARSFTLKNDCYSAFDDDCDDYYPLFEAKDFRRVWQQQSNVSTSIKSHNPSGITNISIGLTNLYANGIKGSGVCA